MRRSQRTALPSRWRSGRRQYPPPSARCRLSPQSTTLHKRDACCQWYTHRFQSIPFTSSHCKSSSTVDEWTIEPIKFRICDMKRHIFQSWSFSRCHTVQKLFYNTVCTTSTDAQRKKITLCLGGMFKCLLLSAVESDFCCWNVTFYCRCWTKAKTFRLLCKEKQPTICVCQWTLKDQLSIHSTLNRHIFFCFCFQNKFFVFLRNNCLLIFGW